MKINNILFIILIYLFSFVIQIKAQWTQLNGPYSPNCSSFSIKSNNIYVGTFGGGVYLSTNDGVSWLTKNNGLGTSYVSALLVSDTAVLAGTYDDGIYISFDDGDNWLKDGYQGYQRNPGPGIFSLNYDSNTVYAGTSNGLMYSTDISFRYNWAFTGISTIIRDMARIDTNLFAAGNDGIYLLTEKGASWKKVTTNLYNIWTLAVLDTLIFAGSYLPGGVYVSTDMGESWVNVGLKDTSVFTLVFKDNYLFAGTLREGVFRSTNYGKSWQQIGLKNFRVQKLFLNGTSLFAETSGGIFKSEDNGITWADISNGLDATISSIVFSGNNIYASNGYIDGPGGGVFISTNNGNSWERNNDGLNNIVVKSLAVSNSNLYAGTIGGGIFMSQDNGLSWNEINNGLDSDKKMVNTIFINDTTIFAGTWGGVIRSTDNGTNWVTVNNGLTMVNPDLYSSMAVTSFVTKDTLLFAGMNGGGVFRSTDNGTNWTISNNGLPNIYVNAIATIGTNLFAGNLDNGGVSISKDNGETWEVINNGLTNTNIQTLIALDSMLIAGTYNGIFFTLDNGNNWSEFNDGLTSTSSKSMTYKFVTALAVSDGYIYTGIYSGGIWKRPINDILTSLDNIDALPKKYLLSQNYPNPFNPSTIIQYSLPNASIVTIKLYDVLGREVKTLVNEYKAAGKYSYTLNALNLSAGIYFYSMKAGDFVETKKLILLK